MTSLTVKALLFSFSLVCIPALSPSHLDLPFMQLDLDKLELSTHDLGQTNGGRSKRAASDEYPAVTDHSTTDMGPFTTLATEAFVEVACNYYSGISGQSTYLKKLMDKTYGGYWSVVVSEVTSDLFAANPYIAKTYYKGKCHRYRYMIWQDDKCSRIVL